MRAANMQALTTALEHEYPGITIYGIGDAAHKLEVSDHNEDDTPGVRAEQSDSDNVPEHRAIDAMLGSSFTHAEADALVARMLKDKATTNRLYYIIWDHHIWSRSDGWVQQEYNGSNPHTDHVHFSGLAANDEDSSPWPIVSSSAPVPTPPHGVLHRTWPRYMPTDQFFGLITGGPESHGGYYLYERPDVQAIQQRLITLGFVKGISNPLSSWADGKFEQPTKDAVSAWQRKLYPSLTSRYGEVWTDDWARLFTY